MLTFPALSFGNGRVRRPSLSHQEISRPQVKTLQVPTEYVLSLIIGYILFENTPEMIQRGAKRGHGNVFFALVPIVEFLTGHKISVLNGFEEFLAARKEALRHILAQYESLIPLVDPEVVRNIPVVWGPWLQATKRSFNLGDTMELKQPDPMEQKLN